MEAETPAFCHKVKGDISDSIPWTFDDTVADRVIVYYLCRHADVGSYCGGMSDYL